VHAYCVTNGEMQLQKYLPTRLWLDQRNLLNWIGGNLKGSFKNYYYYFNIYIIGVSGTPNIKSAVILRRTRGCWEREIKREREGNLTPHINHTQSLDTDMHMQLTAHTHQANEANISNFEISDLRSYITHLHKHELTWQDWAQSKRTPAWWYATNDTIKQKTDLFSFCTCKKKNTSPYRDREKRNSFLMSWACLIQKT